MDPSVLQEVNTEKEENGGMLSNNAGIPGAKKRVLATTTATAVTTMSKRRMSMKNRRVSFAPDPELTMIREFEKDDGQSPMNAVPDMHQAEPMMISPPPEPVVGHRVSIGDITAGLPTLGELAEEEEEYLVGNDNESGLQIENQAADVTHNVTAAIPGLGALVEEDIQLDERPEASEDNKWGFMPGNDDTMDFDLKGHGRMFMGDKTYSKMYADNVTANSLASIEAPVSAEKSVYNERRETLEENGTKGPNWTAPAFARHPALEQHSPNFTDSSIGTTSTRRISVDGRRMSVSSRRISMVGNFSKLTPVASAPEGEEDEEDLLAESPNSMNAKSFDVLAGLKNRLSSVTKSSPHKRRSLPLVPEDMEMPEESFHSPTASGAHIMNRSPPPSALSGRRQSMSVGRRLSMRRDSISGVIPGKTTPGSVSKSVMSTPIRTNPLAPVGVNPANSNSLAPPGSAIAARYPGSAIATGRLSQGFTPSRLAPITFQDFAKIVEVQFLDNLRRGASINYADLQPNPVPSNIKEAYALLCITSPNVAELETAIHTLQSEISRLRGSAADLEVMLGQTNPAIFRHVQTSSYEQLEALRNNVASLKKACRAKATALLKDVRCQMEESKHGRLCRACDGLNSDLEWFREVHRHTKGIAKAVTAFAHEKRAEMASKRKDIITRLEMKKRLEAARVAANDSMRANSDREQRLTSIESSANNLDAEMNQMQAEKMEIEAEIQKGQASLMNASTVPESVGHGEAEDVAEALGALDLYEKCSGMRIQSCSTYAGAFTCVLNVNDAFIMEISHTQGSNGVTVTVKPRQSKSTLAMKLFSQKESCSFSCERGALACVTQTLVAQLYQASAAAKELEGIRADCRNICEITPVSSQYDAMGHRSRMAIRIGCLGIRLGVKFSLELNIKDLICDNVDVLFGEDIVSADQIRAALVEPSRRRAHHKGLALLCDSLCSNLIAAK